MNRDYQILMEINNYSTELLNIQSEDFFHYTTNKMKEIFGLKAVFINRYDENTKEISYIYSTINDSILYRVSKILGENIKTYKIKINKEQYRIIINNPIGKVFSLTDLTFGKIPKKVDLLMNNILGIGWFRILPIINNNKLYGTFIMAGSKGKNQPQDKELQAFLGITTNALIRKEYEEELKKREKNYKALFSNTSDGVAFISKDFKIADINKSFTKIFGYEKEECIGKKLNDLIVDDAMLEEGKKIDKIVRKKSNYQIETVRKTKDNRRINVIIKSVGIDDDPSTEGYAIYTDITKSKKDKEVLELEKKRLDSLFNNSIDGIVAINNKHCIVDINKRFEELFGYNLEEIKGKDLDDILDAGKGGTANRNYSKMLLSGEKLQLQGKRYNKKGEGINLSIKAIPITIGNELQGAYVLYTDITVQKEQEESIRKSLKEKEIMLKEIHHRVKNNMQIVNSLLNLQRGRINDELLNKEFEETINRIKAMSLVHEMLYRSENMSNIKLKEHTKKIVELIVSNSLINKKISTEYEIEDVSLDINEAIPFGLILNELVTNSIKHGFKDMNECKLEIKAKKTEGKVVFTLKDNGKGLKHKDDINKSNSLGWELITALIDELDGDIKVSNSDGLKVDIVFKKVSQ